MNIPTYIKREVKTYCSCCWEECPEETTWCKTFSRTYYEKTNAHPVYVEWIPHILTKKPESKNA